MLHRFPLNAAHGCTSRAGSPGSASSISNPKASSAAVSREASSASANNDPSQQSPHRVHKTSVKLGFMDATVIKDVSPRPKTLPRVPSLVDTLIPPSPTATKAAHNQRAYNLDRPREMPRPVSESPNPNLPGPLVHWNQKRT